MLLGCIGVVMTAASTFFVHRIYSGELTDTRALHRRTEMSALVGADQDSDMSDEESGHAQASAKLR